MTPPELSREIADMKSFVSPIGGRKKQCKNENFEKCEIFGGARDSKMTMIVCACVYAGGTRVERLRQAIFCAK
jgi:hypothetical protein